MLQRRASSLAFFFCGLTLGVMLLAAIRPATSAAQQVQPQPSPSPQEPGAAGPADPANTPVANPNAAANQPPAKPEPTKPEPAKPEAEIHPTLVPLSQAAQKAQLTAVELAQAYRVAKAIAYDLNSATDFQKLAEVLTVLKGKTQSAAAQERIEQLIAIAVVRKVLSEENPKGGAQQTAVSSLQSLALARTADRDLLLLAQQLAPQVAEKVKSQPSLARFMTILQQELAETIADLPQPPPSADVVLRNGDRTRSVWVFLCPAPQTEAEYNAARDKLLQLEPGASLSVRVNQTISFYDAPSGRNGQYINVGLVDRGTLTFAIGNGRWTHRFTPLQASVKSPPPGPGAKTQPGESPKKPASEPGGNAKPEASPPAKPSPMGALRNEMRRTSAVAGGTTFRANDGQILARLLLRVTLSHQMLMLHAPRPTDYTTYKVPQRAVENDRAGWESLLQSVSEPPQVANLPIQIFDIEDLALICFDAAYGSESDREEMLRCSRYYQAFYERGQALFDYAEDVRGDLRQTDLENIESAKERFNIYHRQFQAKPPTYREPAEDPFGDDPASVEEALAALRAQVQELGRRNESLSADLTNLQNEVVVLQQHNTDLTNGLQLVSIAEKNRGGAALNDSQRFTSWAPGQYGKYYYCAYWYIPAGSVVPRRQHLIYFPDDPNFVYFYSCISHVYWGRYDVTAPADRAFAWLPLNQRYVTYKGQSPRGAFDPPGPMPRVPGSQNGHQQMLAPPVDTIPQSPPVAPDYLADDGASTPGDVGDFLLTAPPAPAL